MGTLADMQRLPRKLSRRAAVFGSVALPWAIGSESALASPPPPRQPISERALSQVLRFYEASRQEIIGRVDGSTIAEAIARRDQAAYRILGLGPSIGYFSNWPATGRYVKLIESGRRLGLAVELAAGIGLQTYLGDGLDMTWTSISVDGPLAEIVRASPGRSLRVSGVIRVKYEQGMVMPIDMLADSSKAGEEVSLLAIFVQIRIAA